MKIVPIIIEAWKALGRNRLRSLLSILGIIFAVIAVVAMMSIAEGAKRETLDQIKGLGTNSIVVRGLETEAPGRSSASRRRADGLKEADARALARAFPSLLRIAPLREVLAAVSAAIEQDPYDILAVTTDYAVLKDLKLSEGRFIGDTDGDRRRQVCVLGAEVSRSLGEDGHVGQTVRLQGRTYLVIGVLRERRLATKRRPAALAVRNYNRAIFIPIGAEPVPGALAEANDGLSEIFIRVDEDAPLPSVAAAIRNLLLSRHGGIEGFQVVVPQELLLQARRTQRLFNMVLGFIAGISLLVGGIGIMNTMLASVAERTREIGIRRAVGATREHIALHFLCESVALTVIGASLGIVAGGGAAFLVSAVAGWPTVITTWSLLLAVLIATTVGLVSGLYPALEAARFEPVVALRHE